jgi:hypothetical protein
VEGKTMAKGRKKKIAFIVLGSALALFLGWMIVTCATDPGTGKSIKKVFALSVPEPTPLPALPADGMGKVPGYGEPPIPVYDSVGKDAIDDFPVGNGKYSPKKEKK